jgi:two-component system chemotaxis response regulator CheY
MVRFALEDAGYTVLEASDGVEALNCLRTHTKRLVVLLDLNLPRLDGWGLLSAVAQTPLAMRHRYLLVTAEGDTLPSTFVRLLCQLHVPIIAKPYTINRLLEAVAERPTLGRVHEDYAAAGTL